jgi:ETC complex I subunit conserved region
MLARIYRPARTNMQQGRGRTKAWVLEFEPELAKTIEPLMGWTSTRDMNQQVMIRFPSKEAAVAFAEKHGIPYRVYEAQERRIRLQAYADNFKRPVL